MFVHVENTGARPVEAQDYAAFAEDTFGSRIRFPGRLVAGLVVAGLAVAEVSHPAWARSSA
ncbi:hypothetical protein AB0I66_35275 [Streptomyces sp. NPDC050439]|uniref:hypothetical protein n=1 Tax=unclassified Streptomyces TaxID=2593676 RepID=UPI003423FDCD